MITAALIVFRGANALNVVPHRTGLSATISATATMVILMMVAHLIVSCVIPGVSNAQGHRNSNVYSAKSSTIEYLWGLSACANLEASISLAVLSVLLCAHQGSWSRPKEVSVRTVIQFV